MSLLRGGSLGVFWDFNRQFCYRIRRLFSVSGMFGWSIFIYIVVWLMVSSVLCFVEFDAGGVFIVSFDNLERLDGEMLVDGVFG